ncbi:MAG: sulfurtransferase-like selenium metabolism protein YedF [Candidatus Lindowbacteria bacterium]|nr:sulfurtransferase-like selenium metabolism protein YedF [Candidatus Lindowbacteria bacterium]
MRATVVFIRAETIGRGDDELGLNLMMNFIHHLCKTDPAPNIIIVMNAGIKLVVEGSEVLEDLRELESKGTRILACGTCLNFFKVKEKQKVGVASNMAEITKTLLEAAKVITI